MKRLLLSTVAIVVLFVAVTLTSNFSVKGDDNDRNRRDRNREDEGALEVPALPTPQATIRFLPPFLEPGVTGRLMLQPIWLEVWILVPPETSSRPPISPQILLQGDPRG